jgi:phosphatidylinositol alpha-1,6-mannosyltransferase
MQTLAFDVDRTLRATGASVELVALRADSIMHLAWFLPWALLRTVLALVRKRVTHVVCGDAIAWAAVAPAVSFSRVETAVMVHGYDLVFPGRLYQRFVVRWALSRARRLVVNSSATRDVASERMRIDPGNIFVVNPSVQPPPQGISRETARIELARKANFEFGKDTLILTTIGRLVRRKGVEWFVENVVPQLPPDTLFLVAGKGQRREAIEALVESLSLSERVKLLGPVDADYKEILLRGADLCVLPNIFVPGDMEGFGIVAVEAATRGTLVIASAIEGIQDSVIDGVTGVAVEAENALAFVEAIGIFQDRALLERRAAEYQRESSIRFLTNQTEERLVRALGLRD